LHLDAVSRNGRLKGVTGFHRQRLIAENRAFFVSPVSPEILKPGSPL
jgi:hypothetical protein